MTRSGESGPGPAASFLLALIGFYRRYLSRLKPATCRFHPTCSAYAAQAIRKHGAAKGLWLALKRVSRCHPYHPGGEDPVP
jgi:putative membrane protein insertion efficiency factor